MHTHRPLRTENIIRKTDKHLHQTIYKHIATPHNMSDAFSPTRSPPPSSPPLIVEQDNKTRKKALQRLEENPDEKTIAITAARIFNIPPTTLWVCWIGLKPKR